MTWEANDATRCSARLGSNGLQCSLAYDHVGAEQNTGHVYVSGSYVADRHGHE